MLVKVLDVSSNILLNSVSSLEAVSVSFVFVPHPPGDSNKVNLNQTYMFTFVLFIHCLYNIMIENIKHRLPHS